MSRAMKHSSTIPRFGEARTDGAKWSPRRGIWFAIGAGTTFWAVLAAVLAMVH